MEEKVINKRGMKEGDEKGRDGLRPVEIRSEEIQKEKNCT